MKLMNSLIQSPVEQFQTLPYISLGNLGTLDVAYSNVVFTILVFALSMFMISKAMGKRNAINEAVLVHRPWVTMMTAFTQFVNDMGQETIGVEGRRYVNFILALFVLVLLLNVIGMIPYSFAVTSQIVITL